MGPATYLLNMTNAEKQVTFLLALTLIINFICQYLFIPVFGSLGAAYALVISFTIYALILSILIFIKFKFIPHPFQFSKL
jgi:Na+-driven multidrug efflux pump